MIIDSFVRRGVELVTDEMTRVGVGPAKEIEIVRCETKNIIPKINLLNQPNKPCPLRSGLGPKYFLGF